MTNSDGDSKRRAAAQYSRTTDQVVVTHQPIVTEVTTHDLYHQLFTIYTM